MFDVCVYMALVYGCKCARVCGVCTFVWGCARLCEGIRYSVHPSKLWGRVPQPPGFITFCFSKSCKKDNVGLHTH